MDLQKLIFIALILAIAIPTSTSHRRRWRRRPNHPHSENTEQCLRDLCSETDQSDVCWNILKPELHRFHGGDDREIADGVIDLAAAKSREIGGQLDQWFRDSNDKNSKQKFQSCSENYRDVDRNLEEARRSLDSDDYRRISDQIDGAVEELEKCRREFDREFDPCHVGDRNNELGIYLDMVGAASDRIGYYYDNRD